MRIPEERGATPPPSAEWHPTTSLRVRYADTDAQGIVYHGAYFTFFEVARFDLLLRLLPEEAQAAALWQDLAIVSARCEYKGQVRYPEILDVAAAVANIRRSSFEVNYEIRNRSGTIVATGATVQVYMGAEQRPTTIPDTLRALLSA